MDRIIILIVMFVVLFGIGWAVQEKDPNIIFLSLVPALASLGASIFGAKNGAIYAYRLQQEKENEINLEKNATNGNIAIFNLMSMTNRLANFQMQSINPFRNQQTRILEILPVLPYKTDDININFTSLYFLLETDDRNVLGKLMTVEEQYKMALNVINTRSQLLLEKAQPRLEKGGIINGKKYPLDTYLSVLGNLMSAQLVSLTDQMIMLVDETILNLIKEGKELEEILKKHFSKKMIIGFSIKGYDNGNM